MANGNIDLISLDFDTYKASLQAFLSSQTIFKDYDFTGSNMNVMLDLLSVNTYKNGFFINMGLSEGFIDSAQLLNNVRSHAKDLNYTPRSATSAKATLTCKFTATGENQPYIIQKGQSFSSVLKNGSFVFSLPETITVASANTSFSFTTDIYEGVYIKDSYIFQADDTIPQPKWEITNPNADISSMVVSVFEDGSVLGDTYQVAQSLLGITGQSKVYFVQCSAITGNFEILFGDGIMGRQPKNGATIILDYRVTNGAPANGASTFNINFDPTGISGELTSGINITTTASALGGAFQEDIETTRFYAPRWFEVQERGCVESDYEILLKQQFPEIQAITAYGGELLYPPQFGRVAISLSIANVLGLPTSKLDQYAAFLANKAMLTIRPIFIAPNYTYIQVNSTIRYNVNVTTDSSNRIQTIATAAITAFNSQHLNDFNSTLRFSQLSSSVDNSDPSIVSNLTNIQLYQKLYPSTANPANYVLNFNLPLINNLTMLPQSYLTTAESTLISSQFMFKGIPSILSDDGNGLVRVMNISGTNYNFVQNIGTINYTTGQIILTGFKPDSYSGNSLNVFVVPVDNDVTCDLNTILTIEPIGINLTVQQLQV